MTEDRRVVVVTGASAGIGKAIAHRFARGGFRIVAVARGEDRLRVLGDELADATQVVTVVADAADRASAPRIIETAIQAFGRVDCLVNNAGMGGFGLVHKTEDALIDTMVETNLKGPFRLARAALPVMRSGASIINVASTFGVVPGLNGGIYSAVKAGLIGLTRSIAADYGWRGIRSNAVAPGVIRTEMVDEHWDSPHFRRLNQEMTPFDRDGTAEDVANAVHFLGSDEGSYINGQVIALDGGWSATRYLSREALLAHRVED